MRRRTQRKESNKKIMAVIVFALIVAFLVAAGTIAWLTRTSSVSNTFTVGSFESPVTDPKDSTKSINIDGNIYEPSWDASATHKLIPSATFVKDPYIGIGAGSEDAVVYAYVENNFSNKVYFTINEGWEAVQATAGSQNGTYTSGLFKYTAGLTAKTDGDSWTTTPLFSSVATDEAATLTDFTPATGKDYEIKVSSFLHQAKDNDGAPISDATILAAAKSAFGLN